jgi:pimeloyl-ACP methyl ester carboxylesterase
MVQFQPPGFEQKSIQTSLGQIAYYTLQTISTEPPIVFLHSFGGGSSAYEWSQVYPAFAQMHRVIAPDLIGWGRSAHPARDYRVEDYLTTIAQLLQQVAQSPAIVVAASLTGAIAARLAAQQPDLFRSLFLVCPSGFADFGQGAGRRLPLQVINTPIVDRLIYTLGATNDLAVRNFLENFLFANRDRLNAETVAAYLESARQPNAEYSALAFLRGDLYFDWSLYLPQLTVPTAIVWGARSQFTTVELGRQLAALNPQFIQQFNVIPDVGVLPHLEIPAVVTGLLTRWIARSE